MKKKLFIRTVLLLMVIVTAMTADLPASIAESGADPEQQYYLTMDLELRDNLLLANYGVKVYLDNTELGILPQGGRLIKITAVPAGLHTLYFYPDKKKVAVLSLDLLISDNVQIESTLQTHRKHIKVNSLSIDYSNGISRTFRNLTDNTWREFLVDMMTKLAIYGMINSD